MIVRLPTYLLALLIACTSTSTRAWSEVEVSCEPDYFSEDVIRAVQEALKKKGINPGPVDGILGGATRYAIQEYLYSKNIASDLSEGVVLILKDAGYQNVQLPEECR